MTLPGINRRRVLGILAGAGGVALTPGAWGRAEGRTPRHRWTGVALGAKANITLYHPDRQFAQDLILRSVAEIRRLEKVFSLYRHDSALATLNREGALSEPPLDLVRLLAESREYSELTGGAFDVTVQPLWETYARHFQDTDAPGGPAPEDVARALALVDYRSVTVGTGRIAFERQGMAVTLNGIAQGYITDRVADLLRRGGLENVLIDLGEIRGLGAHPDGRPWSVGVEAPSANGKIAETVVLHDGAIATSAGHGTRFDSAGRYHHLFDPRTGRPASVYASVSVVAARATKADALSTALTSMTQQEFARAAPRFGNIRVIFVHRSGPATIYET